MILRETKRSTFFLPLLLFFLLAGCKEDLGIDNSDQNFPLTLRLTNTADQVTFDWDQANVSTFQKYILVRSASPIPSGQRPVGSNGVLEVIFQGEDIDVTEFVDNSLPIVEKLFYKLYVSFGDRFVESAQHEISFNNLLVDGNGGIIKVVPDSNWVILGDEFTGTLRVLNYNTKEVKALRFVQMAGSDNMCLDVATENGKKVLYWWAGYSSFFKFSLPELEQIDFWPVPFSGFSILPLEGDKLLSTQYDYNESFTLRRKSDMSVVQGHYRNDYYIHRTLALLDKTSTRIVEASPYRILVYNVNTNTGAVTNMLEKTTNSNSIFVREMPVSKNGQYFIAQFDGLVYDQNLNQIASVPIQNNGFSDVAFSDDGQFMYVAYTDFSIGGTLLQKFTFPGMQVVGVRRISNVFPKSLEVLSDGLLFVGNTVNGQNKVLVKKFDF